MKVASKILQFKLPQHLACPQPTELRNIPRDAIRLLVTDGQNRVEHTTFKRLDQFLQLGDVLVVNTSATRAAALPIDLPENRKGRLHFSTQLDKNEWLVEIREIINNKTQRWSEGKEGMHFKLANNARIKLKAKFYNDRQLLNLWVVEFDTPKNNKAYLRDHALPIQYEKLNKPHPLDFYQTQFSFRPGSSEMPSAGRGFTQDLVNRLLSKGVEFAPILLHTGVSSLEENEKPYAEYMEINPVSASIINNAISEGRRVIAVGTTAVRAVESAVTDSGEVKAFAGHTELYIEEHHKMKVVNALITGFHEPKASHLHMLQSLAGFDHIERAYNEAVERDYFWHQFGDLHLILP